MKKPFWFVLLLLAPSTHAEVVLDGSLGSGGSLTGPDFAITEDLGEQVGGNLFQSFESFNLSEGESATFSGPESVENIVARVTGGSSSTIDGTIASTIDGANLWFLNPWGVMFGEHASLDITGSFYVSTADYLKLGEGGVFHASSPTASVLTSAVPEAFGFLTDTPGEITVTGATLSVETGETMALVGGEIGIHGGQLSAMSGRIDLIAVAGAGEFRKQDQGWDLPEATALGTITLDDNGKVSASGDGGGDVYIRSGQLMIDQGSILSRTNGDQESGVIDIAVMGGITLDNDSLITGAVMSQATGDASDVRIQAGSLTMANGSVIGASTLGSGDGGAITLTIAGSVALSGSGTGVVSRSLEGEGASGGITLSADTLFLDSGARIATSTMTAGAAGDIQLDITQGVVISGHGEAADVSGIFALTDGGSGEGGDITIRAGSLRLEAGGTINANSEGSGDGGDIRLDIQGDVVISGSSSEIATRSLGEGGAAGSIQLNADSLTLEQGGRLSTSTMTAGSAGDLQLEITQGVVIVGQGGDGDVSGIFSVTDGGDGAAGSVHLIADTVILKQGGVISVKSNGDGQAGSIELTASTSLILQDGDIITSTLHADGGNIVIQVGELLALQDASISTSVVNGQGNSGNIAIDPIFVVLNNSQIIANAYGGNGGNIDLVADHLIADPASVIQASSDLGISGNVQVNAPTIDVAGGLEVLTNDFLERLGLGQTRCSTKGARSSLVQAGPEVLPAFRVW